MSPATQSPHTTAPYLSAHPAAGRAVSGISGDQATVGAVHPVVTTEVMDMATDEVMDTAMGMEATEVSDMVGVVERKAAAGAAVDMAAVAVGDGNHKAGDGSPQARKKFIQFTHQYSMIMDHQHFIHHLLSTSIPTIQCTNSSMDGVGAAAAADTEVAAGGGVGKRRII